MQVVGYHFFLEIIYVKKIGLTGGIGSGKSTAAKYFATLGVEIIDADLIAREVVVPGTPTFEKIVAKFGFDILDKNGAIDRKRIRDLVFTNPDNKTWLESLLHPLIIAAVQLRIKQVRSPYCVVVIPLLVETNLQTLVDRVLVVDATKEQQIKRTMARDKITEKEVTAIITTQATREQRSKAADDIIDACTSLQALQQQVVKLHKKYIKMAGD